jgi:hypothetical protein
MRANGGKKKEWVELTRVHRYGSRLQSGQQRCQ